MIRIYYKDGTYKDVENYTSWEYENDPAWEKSEAIEIDNDY